MAKKAKTSAWSQKYSFSAWQILLFLIVFAGLGAAAILSSSAAPKSPSAGASVQLSPNPVAHGTAVTLTVSSCGLTPGADESLVGNSTSGQWRIGLGLANSSGCIVNAPTSLSPGDPGNYTYQLQERNVKNGKITTVGSATWVVQ